MDTPQQPDGHPQAGQPPVSSPPEDDQPIGFGQWLSQNAGSLLFLAVTVALILIYLNPLGALKVAVGLGLVIFIHELGHFVAAKWCDVHVKTFSIGFGPALPGCQFRYGETTYKIALVPLGGYVAMVGEGEGEAESEEAEEDPRSFKNKSVYQRMLIISAGVIMNVVLAAICFVIAYKHGVEEIPATIGRVESGSAAWKAGIHSGTHLVEIGDKKNPWFADIRIIVMGTDKGEEVPLVIETPDDPGKTETLSVEPTLAVSKLYPLLGVGPAQSLELMESRQEWFRPYQNGSAASRADPPLLEGDRVIGTSDPDDPDVIKPLPPDPLDRHNRLAHGAAGGPPLGGGERLDFWELWRRFHLFRGKPITLEVVRNQNGKEETLQTTVPPAYHYSLGMRMQIGEVISVQDDSPAAEAGVKAQKLGETPEKSQPGDKIVRVEVVEPDGSRTRWVTSPTEAPEPGIKELQLDPTRLPFELEQWADRHNRLAHGAAGGPPLGGRLAPGAAGGPPLGGAEDRTVWLTVLRFNDHTEERVTLETEWDDSWKYDQVSVNSPDAPMPISGLGLAYHIETIVDAVDPGSPAEKAGIRPQDIIKKVRPMVLNEDRELEPGRWIDIEPHQWAFLFSDLQRADSPEISFQIQRESEEDLVEVTIIAEKDETWPSVERGIYFKEDVRLQKAEGIGEAVGMGLARTVRTIKVIYQSLRAVLFGRVSAWTLSGPLTIADVSYKIAGEDIWKFLLFIGMISINLAVINFLPIPVLDGGHMVFLIYEMIRGKPAPERVQVAATLIGLGLILSLMAFVIFLDVWRLWM